MAKHQLYNLIIVAHPDDETIFFGGLIQQMRRLPWHVVVVTDGNGDGRGSDRRKELNEACRLLKVKKVEMWDFPDKFGQRLDLSQLAERMKMIPQPKGVFTHGPLGEYGHPHHQDLSLAVHRQFQKVPVWSVAYNSFPQKRILLTANQYRKKQLILNQTYQLETHRFMHLLPCRSEETFNRLSLNTVESVYSAVTGHNFAVKHLGPYSGLGEVITQSAYCQMERPF